jgi:hypothetical protein
MLNKPSMIVSLTVTAIAFLSIVSLIIKTKGKGIQKTLALTLGVYFTFMVVIDLRYLMTPLSKPRIVVVSSCALISEILLYHFTFQIKLL